MNSFITLLLAVVTLASVPTEKKKRIDLFESKPDNAVKWAYSEFTDAFYFDRSEWVEALKAMYPNGLAADAAVQYSDSVEAKLGALYHSKISTDVESKYYENAFEVADQLLREGHVYFEYADGTISPKYVINFQKVQKKIGLIEHFIDENNDDYEVYSILVDDLGMRRHF